MREPQKLAEFVVPDAEYIRRELPMSEVAEKLGLDVRGRRVRCPQDRAHWARLWLRKNKVKCFTCGARACWSTIDLVMLALQVDIKAAIDWAAARFDVPKRRRRITRNLYGITRHLYVDYPAGKRPPYLQSSIDTLRRSPLWAHLTPTARRLAAFLIQTTPRESLALSVTYRELQSNLQTGNRGTLTKALEQLRKIGLIETQREASGNDGFRFYSSKTLVRLTWGSERFQSSLTVMGRATQYIGSKLNHESDKKVNHGEERKTVKKLNHGAGREKATASQRNVWGDLSGFTPCIEMGIRFAGQIHNFEAIRRELDDLFGVCDLSEAG
jgi:hypothetical protein